MRKTIQKGLEVSARRYRRPFARPLQAAWGSWSVREGVLVKVRDTGTGAVAFGEIAPMPDAAGKSTIPTEPEAILDKDSAEDSPTVAFARWCLLGELENGEAATISVRTAGLLSLGPDTPLLLETDRTKGLRTYKLKVGVMDAETEWRYLQQVLTFLMSGEKLRLDPNRSWSEETWRFWKPRLNGVAGWIEFVEEPFKSGMSPENLLRNAEFSPVPLALDESLLSGSHKDWIQRGWPGFFIIKPSVLGNPESWLSLRTSHPRKVVISSVFETGVGLSALIRLAAHFPDIDHGLGTQAWFIDDLGAHEAGGYLTALTTGEQESLWNRLPVN